MSGDGTIVARESSNDEQTSRCNICKQGKPSSTLELGDDRAYASTRFCDACFGRLLEVIELRYWERYEETQ